jgi:hypothetical protein
MKPSLLGR